MPASMISAPTGGRPNVIGSSIAMVANEPTPGKTPIRLPVTTPIRQSNRLSGLTATEKPRARFERRSTMGLLGLELRPQVERQVQQVRKQEHASDGDSRPDECCLSPADLVCRRGADHEG